MRPFSRSRASQWLKVSDRWLATDFLLNQRAHGVKDDIDQGREKQAEPEAAAEQLERVDDAF